MTIEWAPLIDVPLHRRLEVCAAAFQMYFSIFGELVSTLIIGWALVSQYVIWSKNRCLHTTIIAHSHSINGQGCLQIAAQR